MFPRRRRRETQIIRYVRGQRNIRFGSRKGDRVAESVLHLHLTSDIVQRVTE